MRQSDGRAIKHLQKGGLILPFGIEESACQAVSCIIDQRVNLASFGGDCINNFIWCIHFRQIARNHIGLDAVICAQLLCQGFQSLAAPRREGDIPAKSSILASELGSDSGGSTCNEDETALHRHDF